MARGLLAAAAPAFVLAFLLGCGPSVTRLEPAARPCLARHLLGDACVGVPPRPLCEAPACAPGEGCAAADDDASLALALASLPEGGCVSLSPGRYGILSLDAEARLLGRSADDVILGPLLVAAGASVRIEGITIEGGVTIEEGGSLELASARARGGDVAVEVQPGGALGMEASEATGSHAVGVLALDPSRLEISGSVLEGSAGPGIWLACKNCAEDTPFRLERSIVQDNARAGIVLAGADVDASDLLVRDHVGEDFSGAYGIALGRGSRLRASGLRVVDNSGVGILVDASSLLAPPAGEAGLELRGNGFGLWIQGAAGNVEIAESELADNAGLSLAVFLSEGVVVSRSRICEPEPATIPLPGGGAAVAEGGVYVDEASTVTLEAIDACAP